MKIKCWYHTIEIMMVHFPHYTNAFKWEKQADIISTLSGRLENRNQYGLEGSSERSLDDG